MFLLSKENILEYVSKKYPAFDTSCPVSIYQIGDGSGSEEDDGDGYLNFIYRLDNGKDSLIVKQAQNYIRLSLDKKSIPANRNKLEYDIMSIRHAIVPEYVPAVFCLDTENNIFMIEDVSRLKIIRYQLCKNRIYLNFAAQIASYMARTHFYTSAYYLSSKEFRDLDNHFNDPRLREIMETGIFEELFGAKNLEFRFGPELLSLAEQMKASVDFNTERRRLEHIFMTKGECLIHGDLHTSNIMASQDELKVIDHEFTFMAPFSYDLGYLIGNFISMYTATCFKDFPSEQERTSSKCYLLMNIYTLYTNYVNEFISCWNQDARKLYRDLPGLQEEFKQTVLTEFPGFAACANWSRAAGDHRFPDYDLIDTDEHKKHAKMLSLLIDWKLISNRSNYHSIQDVIEDILTIESMYKNRI